MGQPVTAHPDRGRGRGNHAGILKNPLASPYTLGIALAVGFGAARGILLDGSIAGGRYYQVGELLAGQVHEIAATEQELLTELHSRWS